MAFQVSAGVNVSEVDLTTVVPAVSSTEGAIAGLFRWGPVDQRILVDSESNLAGRFGKPTNYNAETFFTAANFLSYGNKLYVVRAANTSSTFNALAGPATSELGGDNAPDLDAYTTKNRDDYDTKDANGDYSDNGVYYIAKYPGAIGNSLRVAVCDSANAYETSYDISSELTAANVDFTSTALEATVGSTTLSLRATSTSNTAPSNLVNALGAVADKIAVGDVLVLGNTTIGTQSVKVVSVGDASISGANVVYSVEVERPFALSANWSSTSLERTWEFAGSVDGAPGTSAHQLSFGNTAVTDELHVVVVDEGGLFSGVPGTILEVFQAVSRARDAKTIEGATNFYKEVINQSSNYIWFTGARSGAPINTSALLVNSTNSQPGNYQMAGAEDGSDEATVDLATVLLAYDKFSSAEEIDVSLILQGKARGGAYGEQIANYLIDNIAESRKDCVVFCSPARQLVVNNAGNEAADIVDFRNACRSSSYAVLDSGYKYQYDKYNDVYRFVPLNGDTAGLCVRTDSVRDPWWSPAGFNRGQIKNIIKLAYNPRKADRDTLYKAGVNPVVTFPGQGTVLYGDKTLLSRPSAFDRINVRRLFITLEKAIATAAKFTLFEFNDDFTRAQFRNLVEPFLRDVQGRRGIYDFRVICDASNNTGEVIDRNEFVGDIYIKPAKSINYIQLNFVSVRTGVEFSEIVGRE